MAAAMARLWSSDRTLAVLGVVDVDPSDAVLDPGADHSRPSVRRSSGTHLGLRRSWNEVKPSMGSGPTGVLHRHAVDRA